MSFHNNLTGPETGLRIYSGRSYARHTYQFRHLPAVHAHLWAVDIQLDAVSPDISKAEALNLAMQFTIDVLIFLLGVSIAVIVDLKPKHGWSSLEDVFKELRSITSAGITRVLRRDKKAESQQCLLPHDDAELLTKYL